MVSPVSTILSRHFLRLLCANCTPQISAFTKFYIPYVSIGYSKYVYCKILEIMSLQLVYTASVANHSLALLILMSFSVAMRRLSSSLCFLFVNLSLSTSSFSTSTQATFLLIACSKNRWGDLRQSTSVSLLNSQQNTSPSSSRPSGSSSPRNQC